jgi:hypothetical protein
MRTKYLNAAEQHEHISSSPQEMEISRNNDVLFARICIIKIVLLAIFNTVILSIFVKTNKILNLTVLCRGIMKLYFKYGWENPN